MMKTAFLKASAPGVKQGKVDDLLPTQPHRINLLQTAVPAAHSGSHNDQYGIAHITRPLFCILVLSFPCIIGGFLFVDKTADVLGGRRQIIFIHPAAAICVSAVCLLFLSGDGEGLQVQPAKTMGVRESISPTLRDVSQTEKDLADQAGNLEYVLFLQALQQGLKHLLLPGGPHIVAVDVADTGVSHCLVAFRW